MNSKRKSLRRKMRKAMRKTKIVKIENMNDKGGR